MQDRIFVTGGAGFIGSNFIRRWMETVGTPVLNLDKLTYAGNQCNLEDLAGDSRYSFVKGDINDIGLVSDLLTTQRPRAVVHLAAESHVDRSIQDPWAFVQSNVAGTYHLLEAVRRYWEKLGVAERSKFRLLHVSTDEVYGSLAPGDPAVPESAPYAPTSPYSASKAAADHFVRAYHSTYGLPILITNCSNNYGPYQHPEKLIPLMILNAIHGRPLPVYGDGQNIRDWLYVTDHCDAICRVLDQGRVGQTYNIGGDNQKTNLEVVRIICSLLDQIKPSADGMSYASLITPVKDRAGHDRRYGLDTTRIRTEIGWEPAEGFESGIRKTVEWYLGNPAWVNRVTNGAFEAWVKVQYAGVW
jgi:dTDP-glucose 4,6-dehydratase